MEKEHPTVTRDLYADHKIHTVPIFNSRKYRSFALMNMEILGDNRQLFKRMWGKPDWHFNGSHYFHVWVKEHRGEIFLIMTAKEHGTEIEVVRPDYRGIESIENVIVEFAKKIACDIQKQKIIDDSFKQV